MYIRNVLPSRLNMTTPPNREQLIALPDCQGNTRMLEITKH